MIRWLRKFGIVTVGIVRMSMKSKLSLITAALLASLFIGCSKQPSVPQKITELGVIEVSDGATSRHNLGSGRVLVVTTTFIHSDRVMLALSVETVDATGTTNKVTAQVTTTPDQATTFSLGDTDFSLTPHLKK